MFERHFEDKCTRMMREVRRCLCFVQWRLFFWIIDCKGLIMMYKGDKMVMYCILFPYTLFDPKLQLILTWSLKTRTNLNLQTSQKNVLTTAERLTELAVFALISGLTAAGVVLVEIHTFAMNTQVGHTLVPIWNTVRLTLPTMLCNKSLKSVFNAHRTAPQLHAATKWFQQWVNAGKMSLLYSLHN